MAVRDDHQGTRHAVSAPSEEWAALTPHDSTNFTRIPKAVLVTGSATDGAAVVVDAEGATATMYFIRGHVYPIRPRRINTTGLAAGMTFVGLF